MRNRLFVCLPRSCVCSLRVKRKMLVSLCGVRGRLSVVWPEGSSLVVCMATAPALCLPARPPDLFAPYLLKLWAGGAWEQELQGGSLKAFSVESRCVSRCSGPGSKGRAPLPDRLEWAQPPSKVAVTSPAANWELPVPACLWENRPPRSQSTPWTFT